ncbi:hypothetical protein ACQP00_34555 [Dactylosporangium sp. CS-047395]|uniref:hypothetical protein n=1 Tax=Dactylosporangium sp. CS-047395 TaxID=3239936 RepID=UPI003D8E7D2D
MSFQEKRAWIYAAVAVVVPLAYAVTLLARAPRTGLAAGGYVVPLLIAVGASIVLNVTAETVAAGLAPREARTRDERDRAIGRRGEHAAFYVMSIAALVPLVLAMREAPYFWIANALYLSFALAAVVSSVVKIVAYRRGM